MVKWPGGSWTRKHRINQISGLTICSELASSDYWKRWFDIADLFNRSTSYSRNLGIFHKSRPTLSLVIKQYGVTRLNQEGVRLVADLSHASQSPYEQQSLGRRLAAQLAVSQELA